MSLRVGFATISGAKVVSRSIGVPKGDALSGAEGFSIVLPSCQITTSPSGRHLNLPYLEKQNENQQRNVTSSGFCDHLGSKSCIEKLKCYDGPAELFEAQLLLQDATRTNNT